MAHIVSYISTDLMLSSLRKKLKDDGLVIKQMESSQLDLKGEHFGCAVGQLQLTYVGSDGTETMLHMFLKFMGDVNLKLIRAAQMGLKEIRFYDTVLPAMEEFLEYRSSRIVLSFPRCYYALYDQVRDLLALEDLKRHGFCLFPLSSDGHDIAHAQLAIKALADFHSVSYSMMQQTGYPNTDQCPYLEEKLMAPEGEAEFKPYFINCFSGVMDVLVDEDDHSDLVEILRRAKDKIYDIGMKMVQDPGPYAVVAHRDCWSNNMLFRYHNDVPVEIKLFDMQVTSISSLTVDLNNYIMVSTSVEFRKKHLIHLLRCYYDTFAANVTSLGSEVKFTFEEMAEDFRKRNALMLFLLPIFVANPMLRDYEAVMVDPGHAQPGNDPMNDIISIIMRVVRDPKWKHVYRNSFFAIFEEMKYSIENSGCI